MVLCRTGRKKAIRAGTPSSAVLHPNVCKERKTSKSLWASRLPTFYRQLWCSRYQHSKDLKLDICFLLMLKPKKKQVSCIKIWLITPLFSLWFDTEKYSFWENFTLRSCPRRQTIARITWNTEEFKPILSLIFVRNNDYSLVYKGRKSTAVRSIQTDLIAKKHVPSHDAANCTAREGVMVREFIWQ